jgi:hypothetical protein
MPSNSCRNRVHAAYYHTLASHHIHIAQGSYAVKYTPLQSRTGSIYTLHVDLARIVDLCYRSSSSAIRLELLSTYTKNVKQAKC